jgi:hypothetical protein
LVDAVDGVGRTAVDVRYDAVKDVPTVGYRSKDGCNSSPNGIVRKKIPCTLSCAGTHLRQLRAAFPKALHGFCLGRNGREGSDKPIDSVA